MIIVDENVDQLLVDQLSTRGFEILSIRDYSPGVTDREIINLAKLKKAIIITEDKDFGELFFSYNLKDCSVIFLRYDKKEHQKIARNILKITDEYYKTHHHFFITITPNKIRIRKL